MSLYPRGEIGQKIWLKYVDLMKKSGEGKKYDCVIGVSGGTDSSFLLHIAKEYGLRPLAVNLDNGWNSVISVSNIKRMTEALDIPLETYVIDYEEVKKVLKSYFLASLPWVDSPTDIAIKSVLYKYCLENGIKYILNGSDFRTEGKQPMLWTYSDTKQMKYLVRKFYKISLRSFPCYSLYKMIHLGYLKKIKVIRPYYFINYSKRHARIFLQNKYGWEYYSEHHHESIFTKFIISYWLPVKFGIDKRKITYSAQILNGDITRDEAIKIISIPPYNDKSIEEEKRYILKKLDFSYEEFNNSMNSKNRFFYDYPSYYPIIKRYKKIGKYFSKKIFAFRPPAFDLIDFNL